MRSSSRRTSVRSNVGAAAGDAVFELARGIFEPRDFGVERGGTLDERGLLGARLGDQAQPAFGRLARGLQLGLHTARAAFGIALLTFVQRDGGGGFLAALLGGPFFVLGAAAFGRDDFEPALQARARRLPTRLTCASSPTIDLLLVVLLGDERDASAASATGSAASSAVSSSVIFWMSPPIAWTSSRSDSISARLSRMPADVLPRSALHEPGAAEHLAAARGDGHGNGPRELARRVERIGDQRPADETRRGRARAVRSRGRRSPAPACLAGTTSG